LKAMRRMLPPQMSLDFFHDASGVRVRADPNALEQIVLNLATNARDAMPQGGRLVIETLRVRLEAEPAVERPGGEYACLLIRDEGAGMDEETRRRVFEPFFTTKPSSQGSGLGMSIVYGLTQQHGGFVEVESSPGAGTSVRVYLPVAAAQVRRVTPGRGTPVPTGGDERILLVEDEEPLRRVAQRALERLGYTVVPATDGEQALELYRGQEDRIDLVITDLMMPRLGGVALYEALRREGRRTRFLFTSGYSADEILDQDFPEGGPALLQKPWSLADFTAKVREVLDREEEPRSSG
ncbi:MAG: ATP-binding protein, partial [Gemmatimonadales bacterium]